MLGPIDGDEGVLDLTFGESWPPFFLVFILLANDENDVSALGVPLGLFLDDWLEKF